MDDLVNQVILTNGALCPLDKLEPGMMLMGANSTPQRLNRVEKRKTQAFKISPKHSEPFLIGFDQPLLFSELNEVKNVSSKRVVDYYYRVIEPQKKQRGLVKTGIDFSQTPVPFDPYFMGLLLGSGIFSQHSPEITLKDSNVLYFVRKTIDNCWGKYREASHKSGASRIVIKQRKGVDSLAQHLKTLGLWGITRKDKFIPDVFLFSDKETRLKLLAGLVDSSACPHGARIVGHVLAKKFIKDVSFLARSLGFRANVHVGANYLSTCIRGDFSCLNEYFLRNRPPLKEINVSRDPFTIVPDGITELFYLDIDSYITGNFTLRRGGF
jgi:hypothetical protein